MKKEVQALINRRRARMVPGILAGLAAVIVLIGVVAVITFLFSEAGQVALRGTKTPTATLTFTPLPPTPTPKATPTPSDTPPPTPTVGPSPTPTQFIYVVQEYDTLYDISLKFKVDVEAIKQANNLTSDVLSVGQQLIIPSGEIPTLTPSPWPSDAARGTRIQYKVLFGDTLESIAAKFNSKVEEISKANPDPTDPKNAAKFLTNDKLRAGMMIAVPVNLVTPTPAPTGTATPGG